MHNHELTPTAYRVLTMVGHCFNGVGSVWLARHATSGNLVAVKKYDVDKCSFEVLSILQVCTCNAAAVLMCFLCKNGRSVNCGHYPAHWAQNDLGSRRVPKPQ